jgi:hypothetical protein
LILKSEIIKDYYIAREILDKYVFHFLKYLEVKNKKSPDIEKILNLNPEFVEEIPEIYVSNKASKKDIEKVMMDSFQYDLVMAKSVVDKLNFDKDYFSIDYLEQNYPDLEVDVMEQNPNFYGFSFNWYKKY